ncbi:hypothetical protein BCR32DRAFT_160987 [Anaeromyces robustus]|uniref:Uncharacterized protein n=1 Tax=Anaeromyces robustus TaxID=1754192 RepID=A0A1Y1XNN3_9FUNG|nr:hypothetical protein BCR32DRAFT_160987 [Anaeromyces robustus]|eukprot:ORX87370.1 hypothetical protein BCR32DRAFT_160987 [Anaeromyces robustus]
MNVFVSVIFFLMNFLVFEFMYHKKTINKTFILHILIWFIKINYHKIIGKIE